MPRMSVDSEQVMWREFIELAERKEEPFAALCVRFGISRKTGYKWLNRFRAQGDAGLQPLSRRPKTSPRRMPDVVVDAVLKMRRDHPEWSTARIHAALRDSEVLPLPAPSTIDLILRRKRDAAFAQVSSLGSEALRFEPNYRWRLRFGRQTRVSDGSIVVPMLVRDETTGFIIGVATPTVCAEETIIAFLHELLLRHGRPWRLLVPRDEEFRSRPPSRSHSPLTVWLMTLGVAVDFAFGPDTGGAPGDGAARQQLAQRLAQLPAYQRAALAERAPPVDILEQFAASANRVTAESALTLLEELREQHNFGGRHEAMQRRAPISLYRPSPRAMPTGTPVPEYPPDAHVRLVSEKGIFTFQRRLVLVGRAFAGHCIELKLTPYPQRFIVLFAGQVLGLADLAAAEVDHTTSVPLLPV